MAEDTTIPADDRIIELNKPFAGFKPISKSDFVQWASETWVVGAEKKEIPTQGNLFERIAQKTVVAVTPLDQPTVKNDAYKILERLYDLLPEDYLRAKVTEAADGTKTIQNNALFALDLSPYLSKLEESELSDGESQAIQAIKVGNDQIKNDASIQNQIAINAGTTDAAGNVLESQGMQIGDFQGVASGPANEPVTAENQQELFRAALASGTKRTIDDMIAQINTKGGSYEFNLEGLAVPGQGGGAYNRAGKQSWSPEKAKNYPWTLNEKQVEDLQVALGEAGYFDKVGAPYNYLGKIDQATLLAWGTLLADSVTFGMSPNAMLESSAIQTKNQKFRPMVGVPRMDDSEIWNTARTLGAEVIGRGLTDEELKGLTRNIRLWENEIATAAWKTQDPEATALDINTKVEEYLNTRFESDAVAQGLIDALKPFGKAFQ
jgi:hypothetical protein